MHPVMSYGYFMPQNKIPLMLLASVYFSILYRYTTTLLAWNIFGTFWNRNENLKFGVPKDLFFFWASRRNAHQKRLGSRSRWGQIWGWNWKKEAGQSKPREREITIWCTSINYYMFVASSLCKTIINFWMWTT